MGEETEGGREGGSSTLHPHPPSSSLLLSLSLPSHVQKNEQDSQMSELKSRLDACAVSLSSVEAETEQVTSRMEEIRVLCLCVYVCLSTVCICLSICLSIRLSAGPSISTVTMICIDHSCAYCAGPAL